MSWEGAWACDDDDSDGLDVGLVLSGGGALATTHIGALTIIEEMGIPIHCVVGTSMGSVVGGLYAAGYSSEELRGIFRDSRWPEVFAGAVPRRDEPYLRKEQDDLYLSGYLAGVGPNGLRLPEGLRNMSGLQSLFRQLLIHMPVHRNFDELPTPYRAVAMDLSTGAAVPIAEGDLVEAMLASMAVPGVFPPRRIDGRSLVDGGMASQLPVTTARAMGADVIIALDTTVQPPEAQPGWSAAQVAQQLIRITVWNNWLSQTRLLGERDVMIRPNITELTTSSFQQAETGFTSGETEARAYAAQLVTIRELAAPSRRSTRGRLPERLPETLVVENSSAVDSGLVERRFGYEPQDLQQPGETHSKLRDLAAFGPFGSTDLGVLDDDTARLRVTPLPLGRNLISAGFRASSNFQGDSTYGLLGRYTRRPLWGNGSELRVSAQLGSDIGLGAELYQPFGAESRFFTIVGAAYRGEELLFDLNDIRIAEVWQQTGEVRFRLGRELGTWGILAVDALASTVSNRVKVAIAPLPKEQIEDFAGAGLLFGVDTLDQKDWPRQGLQLKAQVEHLRLLGEGGESNNYRLNAIKPLQLGPLDMVVHVDTHTLDNVGDVVTDILRIGGFRRLTAYPENSLITDQYHYGSVEFYHRLNPTQALVSVPLYVGALFEYADISFDVLDAGGEELFSIGGYIGTETPLGPLFLGAGFADGQHTVFLHFGRSF